MSKKDELKDLQIEAERNLLKATRYMAKSKICQSGHMDEINSMILRGNTYREIQDFAEENFITLTPAQISKHKKMIPYILENQGRNVEELMEDFEIASKKVGADQTGELEKVTNTEAAVRVLQANIAANKALASSKIWKDVIPKMNEVLMDKMNENPDLISFNDAVNGLSTLLSTAMALENNAGSNNNGSTVNINTTALPGSEVNQSVLSTEQQSSSSLDQLNEINSILERDKSNTIKDVTAEELQ